ncbi:MAG: LLM class flavin-dependent oxidoreductase [Candidatus Thorarchaeota archaeon]|jgi:alkanesulfonate monooxygenase SsuD/methylene tetrahydromethanopterin reductase-like flavin-dependent oxidoreductase (luciferase family)
MRWGVALNVRDRIEETIRKAEIADEGGIDQVWVTDFPAIRYAPTVAAAIAERTTSCRIGVGLVSPLLYSSTHIVQFMSTLVDSFGERFDLLLGPGDKHALTSVGVSYSAKIMVDKTMSALEKIKLGLSDTGHSSSVIVGAQGPRMIRASLKADGVLLNYSDLEMVEWAISQFEREVPEKFQLGLFPPAFVGDCQDIVNNQGISFSAAMVAIGLSNKVSEAFGLQDQTKSARNLVKQRGRIDIEVVELLGKEILQRFAFCGTIEQLADYINDLEKLGISSVVFGPPQGIRKNGVKVLVEAKSSI